MGSLSVSKRYIPGLLSGARGEGDRLPLVRRAFARRTDLLPNDPFDKALAYAADREAGLRVFLDDPEVPIDTNHLERGLRPIPMGRRNWLFAWTELGAERVGAIQSLLATCQLQGVNPYTYLVDVLQRNDPQPAKRVIELMPRVWKELFAENLLQSDLDRVRDPPAQ